jgi:hypothetical protein
MARRVWLPVLLLLGATTSARAQWRAPAKPKPKPAPADPSAGKRRVFVEITSSLEGEVAAEEEHALTISLTPTRPCSQLTSRVRGEGGVAVQGTLEKKHPSCAAAQIQHHEVRVSAPKGTTGYVVVDVTLTSDGRPQKATRSFPIRATGAKPAVPPPPRERLIKLVPD